MLETVCSSTLWLGSRCEGEKQKPASEENTSKRDADAKGYQSEEEAEAIATTGT